MSGYITLNKPISEISKILKDKYNHIEDTYDKEEIKKFESLRNYINNTEKYPVKEKDVKNFIQNKDLNNMDLEVLADVEVYWLSDKCLYRYLRACKWALHDAKERLVSTLVWRREFGIVKLKEEVKDVKEREKYLGFDDISEENETGKQLLLGYDNDLRPILYLKPGRQNTKPSQMHINHLVFMLERCIDLMDENLQEKLTLLMDFKKKHDDLTGLPKTKPSMRINIQTINILQTHYPERLGKALLFNMTWVAKSVLQMSLPFMDPMTKSKIVYDVKDVEKYVQRNQLDKEYGGSILFKYEHDEYWPALKQIILEKRSKRYKDVNL
ncbi:CRAL/TRIO domain-containing protein [Hanseniaspora valbyensis NRRL Y-1626]|uniref:CRAL/TRIO domain-containing protein n=1 Tax=Hanseniaspora valbyensis NRRL Y-1626 TaxID=766949 RepID=A0A1B7TJS2_9ASCO|nr:CRAL/TRIO domain-containing protein [Hanseniaspora valbyensis NRRL Y-1626]